MLILQYESWNDDVRAAGRLELEWKEFYIYFKIVVLEWRKRLGIR